MKTTYLIDTAVSYPKSPPFHPAVCFPEIKMQISPTLGDNGIYRIIRDLFITAGFDQGAFNTPDWNPLGTLIKPGNHVVLKPNWVYDFPEGENHGLHLTTQGSFIRVVLDYVIIALKGSGQVTICDGPIQSASFNRILDEHGIPAILSVYDKLSEIKIQTIDLRYEEVTATDNKIVARRKVKGDPLGHTEIDRGASSYLEEFSNDRKIRFSALGYGEAETNRHHSKGIHRYLIANTVLDADVFINLPKMKTHKRTGITGALKNLVGINGSKAYLVHSHRHKITGGDEFERYTLKARFAHVMDFTLKPYIPVWIWSRIWAFWKWYKKRLSKSAKQGNYGTELLSFGGGWWGNQTLWRTIYDINTILFYSDKSGTITEKPQRRYLAIVDGIIGCEGEGPLRGDPRPEGIVIIGEDPISVDACMADLMGFNCRKIPIIGKYKNIDPKKSFTTYDGNQESACVGKQGHIKPFVPPLLWKNHIEKNNLSMAKEREAECP
ncbi:MAG: DUF362 domain-containing protein [Thermodesulfobacteriota bacterium]